MQPNGFVRWCVPLKWHKEQLCRKGCGRTVSVERERNPSYSWIGSFSLTFYVFFFPDLSFFMSSLSGVQKWMPRRKRWNNSKYKFKLTHEGKELRKRDCISLALLLRSFFFESPFGLKSSIFCHDFQICPSLFYLHPLSLSCRLFSSSKLLCCVCFLIFLWSISLHLKEHIEDNVNLEVHFLLFERTIEQLCSLRLCGSSLSSLFFYSCFDVSVLASSCSRNCNWSFGSFSSSFGCSYLSTTAGKQLKKKNES